MALHPLDKTGLEYFWSQIKDKTVESMTNTEIDAATELTGEYTGTTGALVTYSISKSDSIITLTGSDGSTSSVTDSNTTYTSLKNPYPLTFTGGATGTYDGSVALSVAIPTASNVPDAPADSGYYAIHNGAWTPIEDYINEAILGGTY